MSDDWVWSDLHMRHESDRGGVIAYGERPFKSIEDMHKAINDAWRRTVKKDDKLWNLGDVAWRMSKDEMEKWLKNMPGIKILLKGNHDNHSNKWYREVGFDEVFDRPVLYQGFVILSHEPVFIRPGSGFTNVHGHTHQHSAFLNHYFNASVEHTGYSPVNLNDLIARRWGGLDRSLSRDYIADRTWIVDEPGITADRLHQVERFVEKEAREKARNSPNAGGIRNIHTGQYLRVEKS